MCFYIYISILGYLNSVAFLKVRDLWLDFCGVLNTEPFDVNVGFQCSRFKVRGLCVCESVYVRVH